MPGRGPRPARSGRTVSGNRRSMRVPGRSATGPPRRYGPALRLRGDSRGCGTAGQPHLFELVELAHFGAEHMDDHVAGVDQHPIAGFLAFDPAEPSEIL